PSTVTNLMDAGPGSLRQAIADTEASGIVDFQKGLSGTITLTSATLAIAKDLTIAGPGADVITVSGNNALQVLNISALVAISGLTIANGNALGGNAGGIYNNGTLTLPNSTLSGNFATFFGGGIFNGTGGTVTLANSTLSGGGAGLGGGIYNNRGTVTL